MFDAVPERPTLTRAAVRRWLPALARRAPDLLTAYLVPGRVSPRLREAVMLGVTSVNRCTACDRVHRRWARAAGLAIDDVTALARDEAAAYAYGQALAVSGPDGVDLPISMCGRHRRELVAVGLAMELANLAGNRFLPGREASPRSQIGGWRAARLYDAAMRVADRAGLGHARARVAGGATGDVLEIGIGTGLNLAAYPPGTSIHGIDPSEQALGIAKASAGRLGRKVTLHEGDAAVLPYPNGSFDVVVGTFVLCSVGDVPATLRESRRILRPGGSLRFLEHARSGHPSVARLQGWLAPGWAVVSGGCRLDHDVRAALEQGGLRITEERSHAGGLLIEVVAAVA